MFASKFRVLLAHTPTLSIDDLSFLFRVRNTACTTLESVLYFFSFSFSLLSSSLLCRCLVLNHAVRLLYLQCFSLHAFVLQVLY